MMWKVDAVRNVSIVRSINIVGSVNIIWKRYMAAAPLGAMLIMPMIPVRVLAKDRTGERQRDEVEITTHKEGNTQAPENTVPAFKAVVENRTNWIELDVTQTKDGVLAIFHDTDLMKMVEESDKIWDMSYKGLGQISTTSHWGPLFKNTRISTLEEVLDHCKDRIKPNIKAKVNSHQTQNFTMRLVGLIQNKGMAGQRVITLFDYHSLQAMKRLAPTLETGFISFKAIEQPETLTSADNSALNIDPINPGTVSCVRSLGKEVIARTVNGAYSVDKCRKAGADDLIMDKPRKIMED